MAEDAPQITLLEKVDIVPALLQTCELYCTPRPAPQLSH